MLPDGFLRGIRELIPDEYGEFLASQDRPPVRALRINTLKRGSAAASAPFVREDKPEVPWEMYGRYIKADARPGASAAHAAGAFYIQDASAMAPVAVLDPKPGEAVLDMCAAPGGKASQIAARLQGEGVLFANEYVRSRVSVLRSNLERLGVVNACVTNSDTGAYRKNLPEFFDAVLADAPCSGEGMFRRDANAVSEWTPDAPDVCARRQAEILDCAAACVRPGGRLVYSTCTFNRTENETTVQAFLKRHPEFEPGDYFLEGIGASRDGCLRLWPHRIEGEGHFVCRLEKRGRSEARDGKRAPRRKKAPAELDLLYRDCVCALPRGIAECRGGELMLLPEGMPDVSGIYAVSAGLPLARVGRSHIEPSHALAMALAPENALRCVQLDSVQAGRFLQGEELACDATPGWTLMCFNGLPLGWGKASGGVIKNHLPKGLRLRGGHSVDTPYTDTEAQ
ncbi:MAG: RsmF rRNA methyltransferase first C-terminal domain-containing protein [Clostridia bacterium]|nr:RsmF rRNA methyltransferase first C-terminal domain-containing protein [Clostridia bacterium]